MIIQKLFSSKEQKRLRRKYDIQRALEDHNMIDSPSLEQAIDYGRRLGIDNVIDAANKNDRMTKNGEIISSSPEEKKEMERIRDIIREGRFRSHAEQTGISAHTNNNFDKETILDDLINSRDRKKRQNINPEELKNDKYLKQLEDEFVNGVS